MNIHSSDAIIFAGYRPGALSEICGMQIRYYAREWGLGVGFETKVAGDMAAFLKRFDGSRDLFTVAWRGDEIVGSITLDVSETPDDAAHLRWFVVAEALHGQGLGTRLLDHALAFAARTGVARIYLTTFEGLAAARALYERSGFRLTEERPDTTWGRRLVEQRFEKVMQPSETAGTSAQ